MRKTVLIFSISLLFLILHNCSAEKKLTFKWTKAPKIENIPNQPISGKVRGSDFQGIYVQFDEEADETKIYISPKKPLKSCKQISFFVKDQQIVISIKGRLRPGKYIETISVAKNCKLTNFDVNKKDTFYVSVNYALQIDKIQDKLVIGKIAICVNDDEKSVIAGTFTGEYCATRYKVIDQPHKVNDTLWSMEKYTLKDIPNKQIKGMFIGSEFDIKQILLKDNGTDFSLEIRNKKSTLPCTTVFGVDSFQVNSKLPLKKGTYFSHFNDKDRNWHVGFSYVRLHDRGDLGYNASWNLALAIDSIDKTNKIGHGRIVVSCNDKAKTMFAGSFKAEYCVK
ncbi:MAG: hypothetical protein OEV44_08460 [Spirochaetota bacterium]|nr:hypothetical protein [Spirochaetota bacterium]